MKAKKRSKTLPATSRLGFWTAALLAVMTGIYMMLLGAFMLSGGVMPPPEPLQTMFHILLLATLPVIVFFWSLLHRAGPVERKVFSQAALAFVSGFTTLIAINRFVALSVVPQSIASGNTEGLQWFMPYQWPSIMLALEILGWGFFFGLACMSVAFIFRDNGLERAIFWTLLMTAISNLLIVISQILNLGTLMAMLVPFAWGIGPIAAFTLMAFWFRRQA